jgi:hypothetical protein
MLRLFHVISQHLSLLYHLLPLPLHMSQQQQQLVVEVNRHNSINRDSNFEQVKNTPLVCKNSS